jgi:hypothetical protein
VKEKKKKKKTTTREREIEEAKRGFIGQIFECIKSCKEQELPGVIGRL